MINTATQIVRRYFTGKDSHFVFRKADSLPHSDISDINLYIHIPFCNNLCPYCPYNKIEYDKALVGPYLKAVLKEIELYSGMFGRLDIASIYIGGGTPTLLIDELGAILTRIREKFKLSGDICIETNPRGLTDEVVCKLKQHGISLISIGVQSFQDRFLEFIGRKYRAAILDETIGRTIKAGFKSVNLDLMFALPGQTCQDITSDLDKAIGLGVNQVTMYPLFTFPYSSIGQYLRLKKVKMPDITVRHKLYYHLYDHLIQNGFDRVSVWGFKKNDVPRYSSVTRDNYIGLGAGAGSHLPEGFFLNTFSVQEYINKCNTGLSPAALCMKFTKEMRDYFWLYWRFYDTRIPKQGLLDRFGREDGKIKTLFSYLKRLDLLSDNDGYFLLNKKGAFWLHLAQNYFSLRYVNRVWSVAMKEAYPKEIRL